MKVVNVNERPDLGIAAYSIMLTLEEYKLLDVLTALLNTDIRELIRDAIYWYIGKNIRYITK